MEINLLKDGILIFGHMFEQYLHIYWFLNPMVILYRSINVTTNPVVLDYGKTMMSF